MKTYLGGQEVAQGVYWAWRTGEFFQGTVLPGGSDRHYMRVPAFVALTAGPLLGLGFVVFMPVIGIVGLLAFLAHRLVALASWVAQEAAPVAVPSWVPGVSYLVRGPRVTRPPVSVRQGTPRQPGIHTLKAEEQEVQDRRRMGEK